VAAKRAVSLLFKALAAWRVHSTKKIERNSTWKPMPESGRDCLIRAEFVRQRDPKKKNQSARGLDSAPHTPSTHEKLNPEL